jgi:hypothetical protein
MSTVAISIDVKNPAETLACYGLLALDFLLDKEITRSRFVESLNAELGQDGEFRTGSFEFDHADFQSFLSRCREVKLSINSKEQVSIASGDKVVLMLDWYQRKPLLFANANFSIPTVTAHAKSHHDILCKVIAQLENPCDLFSLPVEDDRAHHLTAYNASTKNYLDAGGVYEADPMFYASEWFLTIALQVFRHYFEPRLWKNRLTYSIFSEWLPTSAAFAAVAGGHQSCKCYESERAKFGKGSVLRVAREISQA